MISFSTQHIHIFLCIYIVYSYVNQKKYIYIYICVYVLIYLLFQPFPRFRNSLPSEKKTRRHTMQKNSIKIQEIDSWQLQESDPVSDQDTWRLCCHLDSSWIVQSKEHVWGKFWSRNNKSPDGCDCICQSSICSFSWTLLLAVSSVSQRTEMTSLGSPYRCRVARSLHCSWPPEAGCRNLQGVEMKPVVLVFDNPKLKWKCDKSRVLLPRIWNTRKTIPLVKITVVEMWIWCSSSSVH